MVVIDCVSFPSKDDGCGRAIMLEEIRGCFYYEGFRDGIT